MFTEPIVEEIHRVREQLLAESAGDLDKLIESLKASEREHPERLASPAPARKWHLPAEQPTV